MKGKIALFVYNGWILNTLGTMRCNTMKDKNIRAFSVLSASTSILIVVSLFMICSCSSSTFTGIGDTPEIVSDAYNINEGSAIHVTLEKVPELKDVGGSVKIIDFRILDSIIIARTGEGNYVVASIHCTHRGTELEYHHDDKCFRCSSIGGSRFKLDGSRIGGPAKKPIKIYRTSLEKGILIIYLND